MANVSLGPVLRALRSPAAPGAAMGNGGTGTAEPGLLDLGDEDVGAACRKSPGDAPRPCSASLLWYVRGFLEGRLSLPTERQPRWRAPIPCVFWGNN